MLNGLWNKFLLLLINEKNSFESTRYSQKNLAKTPLLELKSHNFLTYRKIFMFLTYHCVSFFSKLKLNFSVHILNFIRWTLLSSILNTSWALIKMNLIWLLVVDRCWSHGPRTKPKIYKSEFCCYNLQNVFVNPLFIMRRRLVPCLNWKLWNLFKVEKDGTVYHWSTSISIKVSINFTTIFHQTYWWNNLFITIWLNMHFIYFSNLYLSCSITFYQHMVYKIYWRKPKTLKRWLVTTRKSRLFE